MQEPRCLDDRSWEDIKIDAQMIAGQYHLGDFKNDVLTDGTSVQFRIIGIDHDVSADGKIIPLTWEMVDCLPGSYCWQRDGDRVLSFPDTELWHKMNDPTGDVYNLMPAAIRELLVPAVKKTYAPSTESVVESVDKFWIKSEQETFGRRFFSGPGEGRWYGWYALEDVPWWKLRNGDPQFTLLRSPHHGDTGGFCLVSGGGRPDWSNAWYSYGLAPAFGF